VFIFEKCGLRRELSLVYVKKLLSADTERNLIINRMITFGVHFTATVT